MNTGGETLDWSYNPENILYDSASSHWLQIESPEATPLLPGAADLTPITLSLLKNQTTPGVAYTAKVNFTSNAASITPYAVTSLIKAGKLCFEDGGKNSSDLSLTLSSAAPSSTSFHIQDCGGESINWHACFVPHYERIYSDEICSSIGGVYGEESTYDGPGIAINPTNGLIDPYTTITITITGQYGATSQVYRIVNEGNPSNTLTVVVTVNDPSGE